MWVPKGCERCGGDLYKTKTEDGLVATCLQCGREFLDRPLHRELTSEQLYALFHEDEHPAMSARAA
ncbi:MAG: hypothetical protein JO247_24055 [Chloroflexi bacterium]|nr:hypothetical protein [Chloroflexota bacterium]